MEIKTLASGSKGNCYIVSDGSSKILLECGISLKEIKKGCNFNLNSIDFCLVSHRHHDHNKSIKEVSKAGIDTFATKETFEGFEHHRCHAVEPLKTFEVASYKILAFETEHDCDGAVGFLIQSKVTNEKLLFATDTYYLKYKFKGLTHIMIECNYVSAILKENIDAGLIHPALRNRIIKSHFELSNVIEFLKANDLSKVEEIKLIHLSSANADAVFMKQEVEKATGKYVTIAG